MSPERGEGGEREGVSAPDGEDAELDEEIAESFPASDPLSHWSGTGEDGPSVGGRDGAAPLRFTEDS